MRLFKNYFYNLLILLLQVGTPLITIPYISRIFVPELMGKAAFAASVAKWMVILSQLGLLTYGIRVISSCQGEVRLKRFWQLFSLNFIMTSLITILYCAGVLIWAEEPNLFWVQGILLFLNFVEIGWYFSGVQDFKSGLYRGLITKLVSIVLILTVVKTPDDFLLFLFIQSSSIFLGTLFHFMVGPRISSFKKRYLSVRSFKFHLRKTRPFLFLALFINIYTIFDKILVGSLANSHELGLYEMTFKIVITLMVFSVSAGGVLLPKSSELMSQKKENQWRIFIKAGFLWAFSSSFVIASFMVLFFKEFTLLFLGEKYLEIEKLMLFVPPLVLMLSLNNVTGQQILIPVRKEKLLNRTVWMAAIVSVLSNLGLVPTLGAVGAVISWILTEFTCTSLQLYYSRSYYKNSSFIIAFLLWCLIMLGFYLIQVQWTGLFDWKLKLLSWLLISTGIGIFALKKVFKYIHLIKLGQTNSV